MNRPLAAGQSLVAVPGQHRTGPDPVEFESPAAGGGRQGLRVAENAIAAGQSGVPDRRVQLDGFARQEELFC